MGDKMVPPVQQILGQRVSFISCLVNKRDASPEY